ncbi:amidohydrolase family protein [Streptomyces coeruleoprunus]|uniref:Amidohydrolase family protein n=1 Tax=Streptomyces coeruleoprunus TaxID=285563 RepID=A0ABV9XG33_9ACTN
MSAPHETYAWLHPTPQEHIGWDVDVLYGPWPRHHRDTTLAEVRERLRASPVAGALALSTRGPLFDDAAGNAETLRDLADCPELLPVGTVDVRDALTAEERLDELTAAGVRFLRLFTIEQAADPGFPGYRRVVRLAVERGMVLLHDGDPRRFGPPLTGYGAHVVFLDLHAYLLADFLLLAREEPGFKATTRMLSGPDSIERVVDSVGPRHLVFGSRTPFMDLSPQTLKLRYADISDDDRAAIATKNVEELLA